MLMSIGNIFLGLTAVVIGVVTLKYNYQMVGMTGSVGFFEKTLGAGGTYGGFKLLSLIVIFFGFLYMTGLQEPILRILLSPLTNAFHQLGS